MCLWVCECSLIFTTSHSIFLSGFFPQSGQSYLPHWLMYIVLHSKLAYREGTKKGRHSSQVWIACRGGKGVGSGPSSALLGGTKYLCPFYIQRSSHLPAISPPDFLAHMRKQYVILFVIKTALKLNG